MSYEMGVAERVGGSGSGWGYYRDGKEKGGNMEAKVDTIHAVALQR
jgi:hypothetical protein